MLCLWLRSHLYERCFKRHLFQHVYLCIRPKDVWFGTDNSQINSRRLIPDGWFPHIWNRTFDSGQLIPPYMKPDVWFRMVDSQIDSGRLILDGWFPHIWNWTFDSSRLIPKLIWESTIGGNLGIKYLFGIDLGIRRLESNVRNRFGNQASEIKCPVLLF